jgi:hypothetical protein
MEICGIEVVEDRRVRDWLGLDVLIVDPVLWRRVVDMHELVGKVMFGEPPDEDLERWEGEGGR